MQGIADRKGAAAPGFELGELKRSGPMAGLAILTRRNVQEAMHVLHGFGKVASSFAAPGSKRGGKLPSKARHLQKLEYLDAAAVGRKVKARTGTEDALSLPCPAPPRRVERCDALLAALGRSSRYAP
jgi:hypothetical protein